MVNKRWKDPSEKRRTRGTRKRRQKCWCPFWLRCGPSYYSVWSLGPKTTVGEDMGWGGSPRCGAERWAVFCKINFGTGPALLLPLLIDFFFALKKWKFVALMIVFINMSHRDHQERTKVNPTTITQCYTSIVFCLAITVAIVFEQSSSMTESTVLSLSITQYRRQQ